MISDDEGKPDEIDAAWRLECDNRAEEVFDESVELLPGHDVFERAHDRLDQLRKEVQRGLEQSEHGELIDGRLVYERIRKRSRDSRLLDELLLGLPLKDRRWMRPYVSRIVDVIGDAGGTCDEVWLEFDCPEVRFTLPDNALYHPVRRAIAKIHEEMHAPFLEGGPLRVKTPEHLRRKKSSDE